MRSELEELHQASFGWARRCCGGNEIAAEDVLQSAYLKVLSGKVNFRGDSKVQTWFFGVIRMTALEYFRSRRQEVERLGEFRSEHDSSSPESEVDPRVEQIRVFMNQLPERQREVLHLVALQGMTLEEAADVMGVTVGTARQHYHRSKSKIRNLIEDEHGARSHG